MLQAPVFARLLEAGRGADFSPRLAVPLDGVEEHTAVCAGRNAAHMGLTPGHG